MVVLAPGCLLGCLRQATGSRAVGVGSWALTVTGRYGHPEAVRRRHCQSGNRQITGAWHYRQRIRKHRRPGNPLKVSRRSFRRLTRCGPLEDAASALPLIAGRNPEAGTALLTRLFAERLIRCRRYFSPARRWTADHATDATGCSTWQTRLGRPRNDIYLRSARHSAKPPLNHAGPLHRRR